MLMQRLSLIILAVAVLAAPATAPAQYLVGGLETHLADGMVVHYTFDLQRRYNLDEIRMIYMGGNYAGIQPPDSLLVSFSDDGVSFSDPTMYTPFSATPPVADPNSLTVEEALVEIGGQWTRYVRLEFRNSAQWTFLGDVAFVAVPEPNTLLLLVAGGFLVVMPRRRRHVRQ